MCSVLEVKAFLMKGQLQWDRVVIKESDAFVRLGELEVIDDINRVIS